MRAPHALGDKVVVSTVAGTGHKDYPLAAIPSNVSYKTVSDQPEAELNQPVSVPISFHGGLAYDHYDERTGGCLVNTGILCNEPNVLRAPVKVNTVTLTDADAPPMYFFEALAPNATVTRDTAAGYTEQTGTGTSISFSQTVTANNSDRLLLVVITYSSSTGGLVTGLTYGGVAMTKKGYKMASTNTTDIWYLLSPATGSNTVSGIISLGNSWTAAAVAYYNVNQAEPFGTVVKATAASASPSITLISATGEECFAAVGTAATNTSTAGASETELWDFNIDETEDAMSTGLIQAGAASVVMNPTLSSSQTWTMVGVPIKPANTPVLYANSVEAGEVNAYKVSLNDTDFGTLLNTKTWTGISTQPMGRPAEWTSGGSTVWLQPLGDNVLLDSLTTVAASTSNDTWSGGTDAYARHLLGVKDQLYRLEGGNVIGLLANNTDPETDANWTGDHPVGDAGFKVTDLAQVAGQAMIPKENGLWEFDGVASATNVLPELGIAERNGQGLSYGRGGFFVPGVAGLYWTRTGEPIGPESHDDTHTANDPSIDAGEYFKHGRWMGTTSYNGHFYGLYVNSAGTTAFVAWAYPIGGQWRYYALASVTADFVDFHGVYVSETSKFSASEVRPCLWFANGNDLSYIWLDKNGAPMLRRGDIDVAASATVYSGRIDFGYPRVLKQLRYISGWGEDMVTSDVFALTVYRDGGTVETVGSYISADGYFDEYWTQDTNDTCRSLLFSAVWGAVGDTTDLNGPHLRDVQIHAVLQPTVTRVWEFLLMAEEGTSRTAKLIRTEWEAYVGDLKKFKLPDGDSFNGVASPLEMLRADEINKLTPRNQEPPSYIFRATIREMPSS